MEISVVVVEDQKETRKLLEEMIITSENFKFLGTYENAETAIPEIKRLLPDVVLMDIHLPVKSGIHAVAELKGLLPHIQFLMCTSLEDPEHIVNALKAGATGYITKGTTPEKFKQSIIDIYQGGAPMSSEIARKLIQYFYIPEQKKTSAMDLLTSREQEILQLLAKGYRYKEIASMLFISMLTVRKHIHNIYSKLQVNSRTDALNKTIYG